MSPKLTNRYPDVDGNWQWPEKTWFRQRLRALKAQENENRRKPLVHGRDPGLVAGTQDAGNSEPDTE